MHIKYPLGKTQASGKAGALSAQDTAVDSCPHHLKVISRPSPMPDRGGREALESRSCKHRPALQHLPSETLQHTRQWPDQHLTPHYPSVQGCTAHSLHLQPAPTMEFWTSEHHQFPSLPLELQLGFWGDFAATKARGNKSTFPLSPFDKLLSHHSPQNPGQLCFIRSILDTETELRQAINRKVSQVIYGFEIKQVCIVTGSRLPYSLAWQVEIYS